MQIDHTRNEKGFNYVANRVRKIAKTYQNSIVFNIADLDDYKYSLESDYGFEEIQEKKSYAGIREGNLFYKMGADFSFDGLLHFIENFKKGILVGKEKVAGPQEGQSEEMFGENSAVKVVTSRNFNEIVENSKSDIMLEFYAPWCGHCQHLKPEYEKTASYFKEDSGIVIAAMDATANEVPSGYDVQGYPTLVFISAATKKPVSYDGEREYDALVDYIRTHRTTLSDEL